ncbi:MAG: hypothetical protein LBV79_07220 [Candidatus Adiutrix sp.]|jgi:phosphoribosylglycinamide formyltransferase-1|nr:hypothetical protein [Candidatus Adiutrix sp.]
MTNLGILCSDEGLELAALIGAVENGRLPAASKMVVADRDGASLALAREAGLYGAFIPRAAFHANRDGYERRLVEILRGAEVEAVALAGFDREPGPVLCEAFPGRLYGQGLGPAELVDELEKRLRRDLFTIAGKAE